MAHLLDDLAEPFEPISEDVARSALGDLWGLDPTTLERMATERDDTFRVTTQRGAVVFKVAHPADPPEVVDMQLAAMEHVHAADPGVPIQRVMPTRSGALSADLVGRRARVLTWLDGEPLEDVPRDVALIEQTGRTLGRVSRALESFEHPAAERQLAWDLARLPDLLSEASDPLHVEVILRFAAETAPALARLPHQVIHNDGHPGNVLVDSARPRRLSGVLDFGDAVRSARVCDVGVSLAYLVPDAPRPWPEVDAFLAGFESVVPLDPDERELLPMLVAARAIMRTLINQRLHRRPAAHHDRIVRHVLSEEF